MPPREPQSSTFPNLGGPTTTASFSSSHPNHPVLSDLYKGNAGGEDDTSFTSPDLTHTPTSMSEPRTSPSPTQSFLPRVTTAGDEPNIDPNAPGGSSVVFTSHKDPAVVAEEAQSQSGAGGAGGGSPAGGARGHGRQKEVTGLSLSSAGGGGATDRPLSIKRPGGIADSPNARSKTITMADGENTFGALNRHPAASPSSLPKSFPPFRIGVSEDRNRKCRRTMEDSHSFVYDFGGVRGQGYFAVFDGHAGKHAAEWCGQNFHEWFLDCLIESPTSPVPDLLNTTFHKVDHRLSRLASQDNTHSGCTAVTAFLRIEEVETGKGFINSGLKSRGLMEGKGEEELEKLTSRKSSTNLDGTPSSSSIGTNLEASTIQRKSSGRRIKAFVKGLTGARDKEVPDESETASLASAVDTESASEAGGMPIADGKNHLDLIDAKSEKGLRRVLYTANVGDARAVLCRGGKAVRLTYDHKGSDAQEAKRITDAGGFVMNNRVNGVLAVTRSLGDSSMKEFVVGSPYTTETTLDEDDEFLIVACDGLWDVTEDQDAVDLIRSTVDPQKASKLLLDFAMQNYSTDNLSVMVVRFKGL